MEIKIYDTNTFATTLFTGNPAKVCILPEWLPDDLLHHIATENNISEVAFIKENDAGFDIRWFNRSGEEILCGHGTLAASHIIDTYLSSCPGKPILFSTKFYGQISAFPLGNNSYQIELPKISCEYVDPKSFAFYHGISANPKNIYKGIDYLLEYESESQLRMIHIDGNIIGNLDARGIVITAPSDDFDFISRCYYPKSFIQEDPVTGSAHCMLVPFWSNKLDKKELTCIQYSSYLNRFGIIKSKLKKDRVTLIGKVITFLKGTYIIP